MRTIETGDWHEALYAMLDAEADYRDARMWFGDARFVARQQRRDGVGPQVMAMQLRDLAIARGWCVRRRRNLLALRALVAERRAAEFAELNLEAIVEAFYPGEDYDRLRAELRDYQGAVEEMNVALPVLRRLGEIVNAIIFDPNTRPNEQATREALVPWLRWDGPGGGRDEFHSPGGFYRPFNSTMGIVWQEIPGPDGQTQKERWQAISDARAKKEGRRQRKVKLKVGQARG